MVTNLHQKYNPRPLLGDSGEGFDGRGGNPL